MQGKEYIELNYYIDKTKWKKGYGKEISKAIIKSAFEEKRLEKVISIIDLENEALKALAKSLGMIFWMNEKRAEKERSIYVIRRDET